jgi:hypothetical protein
MAGWRNGKGEERIENIWPNAAEIFTFEPCSTTAKSI